ncbi:hypothetical protein ACFYO9_33885 [Streptomyces sp. NPDC005863]|uniref:hypothetical protein n=1 Tax=Streptomyces sp. NPDC005863 TaxID=3364735 RepID=UPI0036A5DAA5
MTKGQQFAKIMRSNLGIGARTRRFRKGVDLHAQIIECVRNATYYPGCYTGERAESFQAAFAAQVSYTKHITGGRADVSVITHTTTLTPWQLCALLGDMVDAGITNVGEGERFFADMARQLTAPAA